MEVPLFLIEMEETNMKKTNKVRCSLRLTEKELKRFFYKKHLRERNLLRLIVLARFLSFLSLVLTYVHERF